MIFRKWTLDAKTPKCPGMEEFLKQRNLESETRNMNWWKTHVKWRHDLIRWMGVLKLYDLLLECGILMKRVFSGGVRLKLQNPRTRNQSYYRRRIRRFSSQSADEASFMLNSDQSLVSYLRNETKQTVVHLVHYFGNREWGFAHYWTHWTSKESII